MCFSFPTFTEKNKRQLAESVSTRRAMAMDISGHTIIYLHKSCQGDNACGCSNGG